MYWILIIVLIIAIILFKRYRYDYEGKNAIESVAKELNRLPSDYHVFNNLIIREENISTQIDHVIISPYGIFVIKSMNSNGRIWGDDKTEQWMQNNGHKKTFPNPIKRNNGHILTLKNLLNLPRRAFIPIVVFSRNCHLYISSNYIITRRGKLIDIIVSYKEQIFYPDQINNIIEKIGSNGRK